MTMIFLTNLLMCSFFINRQYPAAIVDRTMSMALSIERITALTPKTRAASDRIPFTITFHPVNNSIKPLLIAILIYLIQVLALLIIIIKKDRNLRAALVKETLPSNTEPSTFRCSRKRCLTCPFVVSRTTVKGPKSTLNITEHFNCTTPNIIYCIQCSNCNKLYIGEIGRRLDDCIRSEITFTTYTKTTYLNLSLANLILLIILFLIL